MADPHELGREFANLFGRFEHALKRTGFLRDKADAQANWNRFAVELGIDFFEHVRNAKLADTLINLPPRKLMSDGLKWEPQNPKPLVNAIELFEQGVCRVRNSLLHGEEFVRGTGDWVRDATLVSVGTTSSCCSDRVAC